MDEILIIVLIIVGFGYGLYRLLRWERNWMDRFTDNHKEY